jgi:hypothetical protein
MLTLSLQRHKKGIKEGLPDIKIALKKRVKALSLKKKLSL